MTYHVVCNSGTISVIERCMFEPCPTNTIYSTSCSLDAALFVFGASLLA